MATRSIDIVVSAKDKSTGVFATIGRGLKSLVGRVFSLNGLLTSALAGLGVSLSVKSFIDAAEESAQASAKLNAVLQSTGGTVGFTSAQLQGMAADLQRVTKFSDDTIVNGQAIMATFTNIRGDNFKQAMTSALDLSTVLGTDLQSSVVMIGKALNDPVKGLTSLGRAGVQFTAQQKEQIKTLVASGETMKAQNIILAEMQRQFGGTALAAGKTFGGQLTILKNGFSDLQENIGFGMADSIMSIWPNLGASMADSSETIARWAETAVRAFTTVEQWAGQLGLQIDIWVLGFHVIGDAFNWLMGIAKNFLGWLGDNWAQVLTDMLAFQKTVLMNMALNIVTLVSNLPKLIKGEVGFDDLWTNLATGFKSTMKELPAIAKFEGSALTNQMAKDILQRKDALSDANTKALADERIARMRAFRDDRAGKNIKGGSGGSLFGLVTQLLPDFGGALAAGKSAASSLFSRNGTLGQLLGLGTGGTPGTSSAIAAVARSSGVASLEESRFLTGVGAASREKNPNAKVEKKLDESNKSLNKIARDMEKIARQTPQGAATFSG